MHCPSPFDLILLECVEIKDCENTKIKDDVLRKSLGKQKHEKKIR